jgi:hypothetical protein
MCCALAAWLDDPHGRIFHPCRFCKGLRAARANHVQFVRIHHPYKLNAVFRVNRTQGEEEADVRETNFKS